MVPQITLDTILGQAPKAPQGGQGASFSEVLGEILSGDTPKGPHGQIPYLDQVLKLAASYGVPAELILAVVRVESGFDPDALSSKGAMGLMQLMPETAEALGAEDPFDPEQNLEAGVKYLREMLDRFGDLILALAAYNAGPGAVERYGGIPPYPETQEYVGRILGYLQHFGALLARGSHGGEVTPEGQGEPLLFPVSPMGQGKSPLFPEAVQGKMEVEGEIPRFQPLVVADGRGEGNPSSGGHPQGGKGPAEGGKGVAFGEVDHHGKAPVLPPGGDPLVKGQDVPLGASRPLRVDWQASPLGQRADTEAPASESPIRDGTRELVLKAPLFHPSQRGEAPYRAPSPSAKGPSAPPLVREVVNELVQRVRVVEEKGISRVEVHIRPEVLGGMRVEVVKSDEGLSAQITAYHEGLKRLLEVHLSEVQRALNAQGVKLASVQVNLGVLADGEGRDRGYRERGRGGERRQGQGFEQYVLELMA